MSKFSEEFTHLIPCAICPTKSTNFEIGPVRLIHAQSFYRGAYGIPPEVIDGAFRDFDELTENGGGDWIAEIKLSSPSHDPKTQLNLIKKDNIARTTQADLLADIAIGCLQATLALPHLDNAHRLTSRSAPVFSSGLQIQEDGYPLASFHIGQSGLAVSTFADRIYEAREMLSCMGKRLLEFSNSESAFPKINEAWCTAVYWYHQALAEPIDTIQIVKFETAIEILLRTENTKGSTSRIKEAVTRITGLSDSKEIKDGKTVENFAASITEVRSRVLHGTWPTFSSNKSDVVKDVEWVARTLLTSICQRIEVYQSSEGASDSVKAMLDHPIAALHQS